MTSTRYGKAAALIVPLFVVAALAGGCSGKVGVGENVVDQADLETGVATQLEETVGQAPASVSCEDDLVAEVDAEVRCTVTSDDGSEIGATVTVDSVDDTDVQYSIQVDES
ncbi:protein of unknown function (DUF4333) [Actinobacteria bacterium IMCC26207]|nr:protein of unknown function (DUF4333) [Actinobacteria bacterium IMCC26207]